MEEVCARLRINYSDFRHFLTSSSAVVVGGSALYAYQKQRLKKSLFSSICSQIEWNTTAAKEMKRRGVPDDVVQQCKEYFAIRNSLDKYKNGDIDIAIDEKDFNEEKFGAELFGYKRPQAFQRRYNGIGSRSGPLKTVYTYILYTQRGNNVFISDYSFNVMVVKEFPVNPSFRYKDLPEGLKPSIEDYLRFFDMTCCSTWWNPSTEIATNLFPDLTDRGIMVVMNRSITSKRLRKYQERGFALTQDSDLVAPYFKNPIEVLNLTWRWMKDFNRGGYDEFTFIDFDDDVLRKYHLVRALWILNWGRMDGNPLLYELLSRLSLTELETIAGRYKVLGKSVPNSGWKNEETEKFPDHRRDIEGESDE